MVISADATAQAEIVLSAGNKMKPCPRCQGTGEVIDHAAIGAEMQAKRKASKMTLVQMGNLMGLSFSYICDLEHGRRNWSEELKSKYLAALPSSAAR